MVKFERDALSSPFEHCITGANEDEAMYDDLARAVQPAQRKARVIVARGKQFYISFAIIYISTEGEPPWFADATANAIAKTLPNALAKALPDALAKALPDALARTLPDAIAKAFPKSLPNTLAKTLPSALEETSDLPEGVNNAVNQAMAPIKEDCCQCKGEFLIMSCVVSFYYLTLSF
jgi:hypothetical protein